MKLSVKGLAMTGGLLWGGCVFFVGISNLIWPSYGTAFLEMIASVYPGYGAVAGIGSVIVLGLYGALDGAVGGALLAWLYNRLAA